MSVVLVVAVASCGGNGTDGVDGSSADRADAADTEPPAATTTTDGADHEPAEDALAADVITIDDVSPEAIQVAEALTTAHGDTGGFVAFVSAMERGYSIGQVVSAAIEGRVAADGTIVAADGGPESPDGAELGVLLLDDAGAESDEESLGGPDGAEPMGFGPRPVRQADVFEPIGLLGAMRETYGKSTDLAVDAGSAMIIVITMLAETGYSLDQIIFATVAGIGLKTGGFGQCIRIEGEAPNTVLTSNPCSRLAFEEATGESADEPDENPETTQEPGSAEDDEATGELSPALASFLAAIPDGDHVGQINPAPNSGIVPVSEVAVLGKSGATITWDSSVTWNSGDPELCVVATTQNTMSVGGTLRLSSGGALLVPVTSESSFEAISGAHCDSQNLDPFWADGDMLIPAPDSGGTERDICTGNYCWTFDLG